MDQGPKPLPLIHALSPDLHVADLAFFNQVLFVFSFVSEYHNEYDRQKKIQTQNKFKPQNKFQFKLPSGLNSLTKPLANSLINCTNSSDFPAEDETSTDGRTADELAVSIATLRLEKAAPWFPALYASP